jgi:hypothetical protein
MFRMSRLSGVCVLITFSSILACATAASRKSSLGQAPAVANAPAAVAPAPLPLERWAQVYPEAAHELGDWAHAHRPAARRLFDWDGQYPEKSHEFVMWTIVNPAAGPDAFVATHPDWRFFHEMMTRRRPAVETFMIWCRQNRSAVEALIAHMRPFEWLGHNLFQL